MKESSLECLAYWLPEIQKLLGESTLGLTDKEKFIDNLNGSEIKFPIKAGDPVAEGSLSGLAIKEGRQITRQISKEVYGKPYMGTSVPLKDEKGNVIGAITKVIPITLQEDINVFTEKINKELEILDFSISNIAAISEEFASTVTTLAQNTDTIKSKMVVMNSVVRLIREISDQTHLLGLNAAIEAAHAGDRGRGFNVVASEIRKLAAKTKDSITQVNGEISEVLDSINEISVDLQQIAAASQEQAASSGEIGSSTREIREDSQKLLELAKRLIEK